MTQIFNEELVRLNKEIKQLIIEIIEIPPEYSGINYMVKDELQELIKTAVKYKEDNCEKLNEDIIKNNDRLIKISRELFCKDDTNAGDYLKDYLKDHLLQS